MTSIEAITDGQVKDFERQLHRRGCARAIEANRNARYAQAHPTQMRAYKRDYVIRRAPEHVREMLALLFVVKDAIKREKSARVVNA